jgi:hypothetical protein
MWPPVSQGGDEFFDAHTFAREWWGAHLQWQEAVAEVAEQRVRTILPFSLHPAPPAKHHSCPAHRWCRITPRVQHKALVQGCIITATDFWCLRQALREAPARSWAATHLARTPRVPPQMAAELARQLLQSAADKLRQLANDPDLLGPSGSGSGSGSGSAPAEPALD